MTIRFYSKTDAYAWLSNFSPHGFELDGRYWPTVEHYLLAAKFVGTDDAWAEMIRQAATPSAAKTMGRSKQHPLRPDWEAAKDDVMRTPVRAKFETHPDLRVQLLGTRDEELVENAPRDYYWGCGRDGSGKNMLGRILMEVREALRSDP